MDDALRSAGDKKIRALVEAALSFPLRLRLNPGATQVGLDSITFTEDLFAFGICNSPVFLDYAVKVVNLFDGMSACGGWDEKNPRGDCKKLG